MLLAGTIEGSRAPAAMGRRRISIERLLAVLYTFGARASGARACQQLILAQGSAIL